MNLIKELENEQIAKLGINVEKLASYVDEE